ncbi:hypothetical protein GCM10011611_03710 [Aliidongia dinghuensis]|uniref:Uncharacterized protein n=1 Tax=Aliidongia dinghuensis TaxID=1867774 RepID=A0A8J3E1J1_9PROT|nr:hypothetical protein [Aliidongia dinghuensis]GGF01436.1 hypothetical protein GCM10011611_03710 [Aliidongia dinghuensis]
MNEFVAVILICLNTVAIDRCTEETAADVMSTVVQNELGCATGWQDVVARSPLGKEVGTTAYVRTICRRQPPAKK